MCPPAVFRVIPCRLPLSMPSPLQDAARFLRLGADRVCAPGKKQQGRGFGRSFTSGQFQCIAGKLLGCIYGTIRDLRRGHAIAVSKPT